jgi:hypothetical protein
LVLSGRNTFAQQQHHPGYGSRRQEHDRAEPNLGYGNSRLNFLIESRRQDNDRAEPNLGTLPSNVGDDVADMMIPKSIVPGPNDVVYGRDTFALQHHGNAHFNFLIENRRDKHDRAEPNLGTLPSNDKLKSEVVVGIIDAVKERGGRFLRKEDLGWVEVDAPAARTKVAKAFRRRQKL